MADCLPALKNFMQIRFVSDKQTTTISLHVLLSGGNYSAELNYAYSRSTIRSLSV